MKTFTKEQLGTNYVSEAKPNEELDYIEFITGKTMIEIMDGDIIYKMKIIAILIERKMYC